MTKYFAFIGKSRYKYIEVLGKSMPNANNIPKTAPEAPTVGIRLANMASVADNPLICIS